MEHRLSIVNGQITFEASLGDIVSFEDETEAASIVASYLILTQSGKIKLDPSCSEPDLSGRPGFDTERFLDLISERVNEQNAATVH